LSEEGRPRRVRLEPLTDRSGESVRSFVERVVERGATVVSDGLAGYRKLKEHRHVSRTVGAMAAHVLLPWVHRAFANLKRWLTGTFHGVRKPHLERYLDEFVFRSGAPVFTANPCARSALRIRSAVRLLALRFSPAHAMFSGSTRKAGSRVLARTPPDLPMKRGRAAP
jgi:transposase-like protein